MRTGGGTSRSVPLPNCDELPSQPTHVSSFLGRAKTACNAAPASRCKILRPDGLMLRAELAAFPRPSPRKSRTHNDSCVVVNVATEKGASL